MSFPPFPPPSGPPRQLRHYEISPPTIKILFPGKLLESSINTMIESDEIKISKKNIQRVNNNLFQITKWLNYEISDKELYERIIEAE